MLFPFLNTTACRKATGSTNRDRLVYFRRNGCRLFFDGSGFFFGRFSFVHFGGNQFHFRRNRFYFDGNGVRFHKNGLARFHKLRFFFSRNGLRDNRFKFFFKRNRHLRRSGRQPLFYNPGQVGLNFPVIHPVKLENKAAFKKQYQQYTEHRQRGNQIKSFIGAFFFHRE